LVGAMGVCLSRLECNLMGFNVLSTAPKSGKLSATQSGKDF